MTIPMATLEEITNWLRTADSYAAIEALSRQPDPRETAKSFADAAAHFYWKGKDLAASVALGRAGAQYALSSAERLAASDPALAAELRGQAKAMTFNLASFTWPGWDEPGIPITPADMSVGLDAAKANLRLARELKRGPLPLSRAHWMLAGHWLAVAQYGPAREQFQSAGREASAAASEPDRLLAEGFELLTAHLSADGGAAGTGGAAGSASDETLARLNDVLTRLRPLEQGGMFVQQIETARRVFPLRPPP